MKKRILFFHSHTSRGGTEQNIIKIGKSLKENDYEVHFCAFKRTGDLYDEIGAFANSTYVLYEEGTSSIEGIRSYTKYLGKLSPDFILNFGLRVELFSRVISRRVCDATIVSNIRSTDDWRKWYHTFLDKITQRFVDQWVSNSLAGKIAFIEREGLSADKVSVIYNFLSVSPLPRPKAREKDVVAIGVLANIRPAKGHDLLIDVAKVLVRLNKKFIFLLAGKDMMDGELFKRIEEENLGAYFEFRGFVKDVTSFFKELDIFLLPSRWEGLPTSVLEAMAHGIPVIATNVGGVKEIIENDGLGVVVPSNDIDRLAYGIIALLDENYQKDVVENGLNQIATKFSEKENMAKWMTVLS